MVMKNRVPHIETGLRLQASCQGAWDLLTDTSRWRHWGPSIQTVECSDRHIRLGSSGRVRTALGFWVPFVVTEMDDNRFWSWQVGGIPATGHRVDRLDRGGCRVVFRVPLFAAPYVIVCRIALHRISRILEA